MSNRPKRFSLKLDTTTFTFTFRAFSRRFYPKWLTVRTFVRRKRCSIYHCRYSKDVCWTKCQALTIVMLIIIRGVSVCLSVSPSNFSTILHRFDITLGEGTGEDPWKWGVECEVVLRLSGLHEDATSDTGQDVGLFRKTHILQRALHWAE